MQGDGSSRTHDSLPPLVNPKGTEFVTDKTRTNQSVPRLQLIPSMYSELSGLDLPAYGFGKRFLCGLGLLSAHAHSQRVEFKFLTFGEIAEDLGEFLPKSSSQLLGSVIMELKSRFLTGQTDRGGFSNEFAPIPRLLHRSDSLGKHFLFNLTDFVRINGTQYLSFEDSLDPGLG